METPDHICAENRMASCEFFTLSVYIYIYTYIYTRCKGPLVDNSRVMWLRGGAYVPTTVVEYESITDDRLSTRVKVHNATK